MPRVTFVRQDSRILEQELANVFRVYRDVLQIRLDVLGLPTFACEKKIHEPHGSVGRKFRTKEVAY